MLCENCGNNEANVKYTQIINGVKKQMNVCSHCADKLGINNISFSMPMNMFDFMEEMFSDNIFEPRFSMPKSNLLMGDIFNDEMSDFKSKFERLGHQKENTLDDEMDLYIKKLNENRKENKDSKKESKEGKEKLDKNKKEQEIAKLEKRMQKEIQEERFEDAAKTRDEIKKLKN